MKTTQHLVATCSLAMFIVSTATVRGQFSYVTNNGAITITKYTGPGGSVSIPSTINMIQDPVAGEAMLQRPFSYLSGSLELPLHFWRASQ